MKAICIKEVPHLTKDKVYVIKHTYFQQIEVINDLGFLEYFSNEIFYIIK